MITPSPADAPVGAAKIQIPIVDVALAAAVAAAISVWCWVADGGFSLAVPAVSAAAIGLYYVVGTLATAWRRVFGGIEPSFPLRLVTGYALVNATLFVLVWLSAGTLRVMFLALLAIGTVALAWARPRLQLGVEAGAEAGAPPVALAVVVSLAAATLWAQDCLPPTRVDGLATVFRPWVDSFFHAAQITSVAGVHGAGRLEDVQFAFVPARFYHYAPYVTPALVKAFTPATAYGTYAGVFVPMGVLMTGLGAYVLVGSWWGAWPGFAGAAALLLLPDASAHGTRNEYLGYHWMQLVGAAGMYGVALLALSWALVLRGCTRGSGVQVVAGWVVGALSLLFKAQFFVASALLLWMFPPVAFAGVSPRRRAAWIVGALAAYLVGVSVANQLPGFPAMRLDGSSVRWFVGGMLLEGNTAAGPFRDFFASHLGEGASELEAIAFAFVYVLACTAGLFAVAYAVLAAVLRGRVDRRVLAFPALVLLNFAVMAVGLARDDRGVGTAEELLHRPFVWAYFVTAAWVGGAAALATLGARPSLRARAILVLAALGSLAYPAVRGATGGQTKDGWSLANAAVPTAYAHVATYLREHAAPDEVVQDLRGDSHMALAGLSERRPFFVRYWMPTAYGRELLAVRGAALGALASASEPEAVAAIANETGIRWLVVHPGDGLAWPRAVLDRPSFVAGGYRVYRLGAGAAAP